MRRRLFLVGIAASLAGCSTQNGGNSGATGGQEFRESFTTHLDEIDVDVRSLERSENQLQLEYAPRGEQYEQLSAEIGGISGGFLREVENGWEIARLDADIVSETDQLLARWHVESAWIEEYRADEITAEELSLRVIETLEFV